MGFSLTRYCCGDLDGVGEVSQVRILPSSSPSLSNFSFCCFSGNNAGHKCRLVKLAEYPLSAVEAVHARFVNIPGGEEGLLYPLCQDSKNPWGQWQFVPYHKKYLFLFPSTL